MIFLEVSRYFIPLESIRIPLSKTGKIHVSRKSISRRASTHLMTDDPEPSSLSLSSLPPTFPRNDRAADFHLSREFISLLFQDVDQEIYELFDIAGTPALTAPAVRRINCSKYPTQPRTSRGRVGRVPSIYHPF